MKKNKTITLPCPELPARPVRFPGGGEPDEYTDFFPEAVFREGKKYLLRVASDSDYNVFLDGELAGFGQYSDYPDRLVYDEYELAPRTGSRLVIRSWHCGIDSLTHIAHPAYTVFALFEDGVPVSGACSSRGVGCALSPDYLQHRGKIITSQMGAGFSLTAGTEIKVPVGAEETYLSFSAVLPRPVKKLSALPPVGAARVREGRFAFRGGKNEGELMLKAEFDPAEGEDGYFFIFDLGRETVGFPLIEFDSPAPCDLICGWGEHLTDGRCRTAIGGRDFSFTCAATAGHNRFFPALRRLGCRYFQIFSAVRPENLSFRFVPVEYPAEAPDPDLPEPRKRIYDTAVHTLRCCMHEHYEDCPWREQALYTLDSRNQMLAGYYVFKDGNREMARASLDLISRGVRPDGLLSLCFPAGRDYPIPFYTLAYFVQFEEYVRLTGDVAFAAEKYSVLQSLMDTVLSRMITDGNFRGLVPRYPDSRGYWNFYEWSPTMSGSKYVYDETDPPCEAPFNAFLATALVSLSRISSSVGKDADRKKFEWIADGVRQAVRRVFLGDDGLFRSFTDRPEAGVSVLTQALCLLCGAARGTDSSRALEAIKNNGGDGLIPATLSMACFRYDALLSADAEKYAPQILAEIDRDCSYMLSHEATTFWETIKGEADFGGAGSLCHGWSAMAAYYYRILLSRNFS